LPRRTVWKDVLAKHRQITDELDDNVNIEEALDVAHEDMLTDIGSKGRCRVFTGSAEFSSAVACMFLVNHYRPQTGEEAQRMYDRWLGVYAAERDKALAVVPRDTDQDGRVEAHEVLSARNVPLTRA
jgi:hypothetical protein